ncbi:carboxypeptidase-like protein [Breznakibacter xylanolyticus]|uniref:Carboxypeptidase-like protein n=1 Tax=Breznakibacter xylanolyticus TaxID=990 RepID=A0A2W7NAM0_9BACT|nr:carboxypeptidase-like regulatory domain-containing protein [Breznakibacter xylanolyticus]PZX16683.1 carboxypeptidase-like protein [Breznakibacter xylanolyticus]
MKAQLLIIASVLFLGLNHMNGEKKVSSSVQPNVCVTGTIVDGSTGETLAGVEVTIDGTDLKTYTDFEGKFSFNGLAAGNYKVVTNYVSYGRVETRTIDAQYNQVHSLNLELFAQNQNELLEKVASSKMMASHSAAIR